MLTSWLVRTKTEMVFPNRGCISDFFPAGSVTLLQSLSEKQRKNSSDDNSNKNSYDNCKSNGSSNCNRSVNGNGNRNGNWNDISDTNCNDTRKDKGYSDSYTTGQSIPFSFPISRLVVARFLNTLKISVRQYWCRLSGFMNCKVHGLSYCSFRKIANLGTYSLTNSSQLKKNKTTEINLKTRNKPLRQLSW